jgi:hypothetical protein
MIGAIDPAWEGEFVKPATAALQPSQDCRSGWLQQLELNRSLCLLLDNHRSGSNAAACYQIADFDLHQVASSQLAVDCKVKQSAIAHLAGLVEHEPNCPNLFRLQCSLCP